MKKPKFEQLSIFDHAGIDDRLPPAPSLTAADAAAARRAKHAEAQRRSYAKKREIAKSMGVPVRSIKLREQQPQRVEQQTIQQPKQKKVLSEAARERKRARDREYQRKRREKQRAIKEARIQQELSVAQNALLKAANTLGINLKPSEAAQFQRYMQYREAQAKDATFYKIEKFLSEFRMLKDKGYNPDKIEKDFAKYVKAETQFTSWAEAQESGLDSDELETMFGDLIETITGR